jgi:DNA polymerase-3 subunit alpha (Gram-positive type)
VKTSEKLKRVELSARTKMSVMDGLITPAKYYREAKKRGQKAIAITDIDNVQSFPDFYNVTKHDENFKSIFGTSARIIDKEVKIITTNKDIILKQQKYVVFDLETTGLHSKYNGIIEFGACKIEGGKVVDKKQFFINPQQKISAKIEELTQISNEDIKDAINEQEGLKEILKYIGDSILIAHNARFDMSFLHQKVQKYNLKKITNIVIDTLPLSRVMTPKYKRHSLGYLADRYSVTYKTTIAHRADYDADVLAKIWIKMLEKLEQSNITTAKELSELNKSPTLLKQRGHIISILAKNNNGLKNLFKLISISHTTNFNGAPALYKEDIDKYRKDLLIGTGGVEGKL